MQQVEIDARVHSALVDFYRFDSILLKRNLYEPTISGALMVQLIHQFPGFDVDVEFSKQIHWDPINELYLNKEKRIEPSTLGPDPGTGIVRPDIIIHKRGCNDYNIAAIEVKAPNPSGRVSQNLPLLPEVSFLRDRKKLEGYVRDHRYTMGYLLVFPTGENCRLERMYRKKFFVTHSHAANREVIGEDWLV